MSKSKANNEQPVIDLLVEASPHAAILIMKRRKLLRTGGSLYVGQLKRLGGRTWLKATMPVDDVSRNPWDLAHETVARYKRDLGQTPYIEPDRVGGEYDAIDKRERATSGNAGAESFDPLNSVDSLDPRKVNAGGFDSMSGMGFDPSDIMRGVMPDLSQFGVPQMIRSQQNPGMRDISTIWGSHYVPGLNPPISFESYMDDGSAGPAALISDFSVPTLAQVPGWSDLHPVTARMLTVETAQLLLSQMPGVPPHVHPVSSLRAIAKLSQCSRVLREVLRRLPDSDDGESGMRPVEPTPPPLKDDGMALELTFAEGDVNDLDCVSMSELAEA